MDFLSVLTSAGHIGFRGRIHTGPARPSLLMVAGAFPRSDQHQEMINWFREFNVVIARLPGMGVPASQADAAQITIGLQEASSFLLRDWPLVVCGGSASGLVTIPLQGSNIRHKVILDPFLTTEPLWPLLNFIRGLLERDPGNEHLRRYAWSMFGLSTEGFENRDYRSIVDALNVPTDVVVGGMALQPERALNQFPSLTSIEDRAILSAHPLVTMHEGPPEVGHDLWSNEASSQTIKELLRAALESAGERP